MPITFAEWEITPSRMICQEDVTVADKQLTKNRDVPRPVHGAITRVEVWSFHR
ncbi:hypothetical protein ABIC75_003792 [Dyella japonica]|uniref:Uncharacterized protein n=1 Tax=Dyella japonica TaxID=231455 RepID=A0ABV2JZ12_9GAMM